jgi:hypothetical protein
MADDDVLIRFGADTAELDDALKGAANGADVFRQRLRSLNEAMRSEGKAGFDSFRPSVEDLQKRFETFSDAVREVNRQLRAGNMDIGYANQLVPQLRTAFEQAAAGAKSSAEGAAKAARAHEGLALATVGARRELMVLAHEAVSGNMARMPGSMMVLAERMGGVSLAAMGQAAALAAVAYGVAQVLAHHERLNQVLTQAQTALEMQGRGALFSRDALGQLVEQLGRMHNVSRDAAHEVVLSFSRIAAVTPGIMTDLARGMEGWVLVIGEKAPQAAARLSASIETPTRFLEELDRKTHGVSAASLALVRELERAGDVMAARSEAARVFGDMMEQAAAKGLTDFQNAARAAANNLRELADAFTGTDEHGELLAQVLRDIASALDAMKTPAAIVGQAFWDLVAIAEMLVHAFGYVEASMHAIAGPAAAAVLNVVAAMGAAARGDFGRAAEYLKRMPTEISEEWKTRTAEMARELQTMKDLAASMADFRLPGARPASAPPPAAAPGVAAPAAAPQEEAIKRAMTLADQFRSVEMRRAEIQGRINQLKAGEAALAARIADAEREGADSRLEAQAAELARIRQAIAEAERQRNSLKAPTDESRLESFRRELAEIQAADKR